MEKSKRIGTVSVPFPEVQNRKGTEGGLLLGLQVFSQIISDDGLTLSKKMMVTMERKMLDSLLARR